MFRAKYPTLRSMTISCTACALAVLSTWLGMAHAAPPPVKLSEPVDVNVVGELDRSVEIRRPGERVAPDFITHHVTCISSPNSCLEQREVGAEGFVLHYISLSVAARDSIGCQVSANIVGHADGAGFITTMLQIATSGNATEVTTLALPVPIRLREGDMVRAGASDAAAGGRCIVHALFGGVRG
jgi:hypothetical protein